MQHVKRYRYVGALMGCVIALLGGTQSAYASSLTVNFSSADAANTGMFQGFNPALGTLDSVDFAAAAIVSVTFGNAGAIGATQLMTVNLNLVFFSGALTLSDVQSITQFLAPGATFTMAADDSGSVTRTTGLGSFQSAGLISLNATGVISFGTSAPFEIRSASQSLIGTVTYNYTPAATAVPEPTTLTLLGLGVAGLAARRWRQEPRA